eukprot:gene31103-39024_t
MAFLSESLSGFPQDPFKKIRKAKTSLWEFVRANIELSPRHPHNLLNLLNQFQADAKDGAGEPATDPRKQDVAAEQQRLIIKGTVMMVPVMGVEEMEGKAVAYVSHILKRTASEFILGGFPKPRQNNVPKVIEVLQLTAAALRFAYLRSARHAATLPSEELPKIEEMESQAEPQPESENKWPGMDDLEVMSKRIDEIMRQRRKHVKRMLAKKAIINKALGELKAYSKPPVLLIRVFSALFVLMGHTNLK